MGRDKGSRSVGGWREPQRSTPQQSMVPRSDFADTARRVSVDEGGVIRHSVLLGGGGCTVEGVHGRLSA